MNRSPDDLATLEEQRRFLLSSLRDLEREYECGDLDRADYESLRLDYIARTADIINQIEDATSLSTTARPVRNPRRVIATLVVIALVASGAGWLVARQSGQRLAGQSFTGGIQDSTASLLSRARATNFVDPPAAIELYSQVLGLDPDNVEALTYRAWLLALIARDAGDEVKQTAFMVASNGLERAIALDATYPDAHCFLGIIRFRLANDALGARQELTICVSQNPPAEVKGFVDSIVKEVDAALGN